jgi:hypothetical protein
MTRVVVLALSLAWAAAAPTVWLLAAPSAPARPTCRVHCDWRRERLFSRCEISLGGAWTCGDPMLAHTRRI